MRRRGGRLPRSRWQLVLILLGGLVYALLSLAGGDGDRSSDVIDVGGPVPPRAAPGPSPAAGEHSELDISQRLLRAIAGAEERVWVETDARVYRTLRDDNEGSRHQRFLVDVAGNSVLISHNIDLAERVPLSVGDRVRLRGRFEWNDKGGVIHWTHHDPQGRGPGGWIDHGGRRYR